MVDGTIFESGGEDGLALGDGGDEFAALGDREGGFLAEDLLARGERQERHRYVPMVGRGNYGDVDVTAGEQIAEVGDLRTAPGAIFLINLFAGLRAAAGENVAHGDDLTVALLQKLLQVYAEPMNP